jgi:hydroxymethylglutaryl-CoA lyase
MKIIECPRDAMQGIEKYIPAEIKSDYINLLLMAGFDTLDFGSFVSPKAVPQMRDTTDVLQKLDIQASKTRLLAIVANLRGAQEASTFEQIDYLGYPLSISETFQERNTNKSIAESLNVLQEIQELCIKSGKKLVSYISMGFGNPYGDPYSEEIVLSFTGILKTMEIETVSLSDTIGIAAPESISRLYTSLTCQFPDLEVGCHLHSNPKSAYEKVEAAYLAGCRRFDGAIMGYGGCPLAEDELVGNIPTETILSVLLDHGEDHGIDKDIFNKCLSKASKVFG